MISEVSVKHYDGFAYDENEILRYAGCRGEEQGSELVAVMRECIQEAETQKAFSYSVAYRLLPVNCIEDDYVDMQLISTHSRNLAYNLSGCHHVMLIAATVGHDVDRIIRKYTRIDSAKALFLQAIGAERVEQLCDAFCEDIPDLIMELFKNTSSDEYDLSVFEKAVMKQAPRYSPGYGDLPLELQPDFLNVVDARRKIGITINDSLLMQPSKSVTAFIGIKSR